MTEKQLLKAMFNGAFCAYREPGLAATLRWRLRNGEFVNPYSGRRLRDSEVRCILAHPEWSYRQNEPH